MRLIGMVGAGYRNKESKKKKSLLTEPCQVTAIVPQSNGDTGGIPESRV